LVLGRIYHRKYGMSRVFWRNRRSLGNFMLFVTPTAAFPVLNLAA
jgi:hypothetical protein